jgi:ribonuclease G
LEKELIISTSDEGVDIALLQDKRLVELHRDKIGNDFTVGDVYLGKVKKIMPGLNAAFVDVGYEKDAFLHYLDLGPQVNSLVTLTHLIRNKRFDASNMTNFRKEIDIEKTGKINEVLTKNQLIPVQIVKEPISSKGPRLSSDLSIAGRFVVMVPFNDTVNVSKKIGSSAERKRLQNLVESIKPQNFGIIIRTAAEGKGVSELHKDIVDIKSRWDKMVEQLKTALPAGKALGELDRASSIVRDLLNDDFSQIAVNDDKIYKDIKAYVSDIAPAKEKIIRKFEGKAPIFEHFGIDKQIKSLFGRTVSMANGAYLIIEHTEALHVIDVNSGNRSLVSKDQEDTALKVNMDSAQEIARQLKLRDIGGIIVIDFIDMRKAENKRTLFNYLKDEMKEDRAKHTILPPTRFGLVQITRQRVRPEMNITTEETCPACNGTGTVRPSIVLVDEIESNLNYIIREQNEKNVIIYAHPYVEAFLKKGSLSRQWKWYLKYKRWIEIKPNNAYHMLEYRFFRRTGDEIQI